MKAPAYMNDYLSRSGPFNRREREEIIRIFEEDSEIKDGFDEIIQADLRLFFTAHLWAMQMSVLKWMDGNDPDDARRPLFEHGIEETLEE